MSLVILKECLGVIDMSGEDFTEELLTYHFLNAPKPITQKELNDIIKTINFESGQGIPSAFYVLDTLRTNYGFVDVPMAQI